MLNGVTKGLGFVGLAALIVTLAPKHAWAQKTVPSSARAVLLLGVNPSNPRTVAIEVVGDSVSIRSGAGLIVPRRTGFWRVGIGGPTTDFPELRGRVLAREGIDSLLPQPVIDSMVMAQYQAEVVRQAAADSATEVAASRDTVAPDTATDDAEPQMNMHGERFGLGECFAQWTWAAPLGSWPTTPANFQCDSTESPGGEASFTFVGPEHLSLYTGVTSDVSYSFRRGSALGSTDYLVAHGLPGTDERLDGKGGPAAGAPLTREIARCEVEFVKALHGDDAGYFEPMEDNPDYRGTVITRNAGRWVYSRYYALTSYAGRGWEYNCDLKIRVPKSVTGWDSLTVPWKAIKRQLPGAVDAYSSPRGDLLVVSTPAGVAVYRPRGSTLGAAIGRATWESMLGYGMAGGMEPGYMVMDQWATGQGAERWARTLEPLLPRVAPVQR